jgi:hypothetical protein
MHRRRDSRNLVLVTDTNQTSNAGSPPSGSLAGCSSKAKMSALSKVEMSVSAPFWESGGCHFDGHGGDEQARAEPS